MNKGRPRFWKEAPWLVCGVVGWVLSAPVAGAPSPGHGAPAPELHISNSSPVRLSGSELRGTDANRPVVSKLDLRAKLDSMSTLDLRSKLDLRPPSELGAASPAVGERQALAAESPAFRMLHAASDLTTRSRLDEELPSLGSNVGGPRPMSRAEQIATRFRREGLPIARLFESRSALISLGLNARGKPGIWLIQKLP